MLSPPNSGEMAFTLSSDGDKSGILAFGTQFTTTRACGLRSPLGLICSFLAYFISGSWCHMALVTSVWEAKVRDPRLMQKLPWHGKVPLGGSQWGLPIFDGKANTHWLLFSPQWVKMHCEFTQGVEDAYSPAWHGIRHFLSFSAATWRHQMKTLTVSFSH